MALATPPPASSLLTFEQYLAEGEVKGRYEILDGVRTFMPGASWPHQKTVFHIAQVLDTYAKATGSGEVITAPFDVLIRRTPRLQTRQPDVLFITYAQLAFGGGVPQVGLLQVAPELIVEVISESETTQSIQDKLADYAFIGLQECWLAHPDSRTIEVLQLTSNVFHSATTYNDTQILQSLLFPDLTLPVANVFSP